MKNYGIAFGNTIENVRKADTQAVEKVAQNRLTLKFRSSLFKGLRGQGAEPLSPQVIHRMTLQRANSLALEALCKG